MKLDIPLIRSLDLTYPDKYFKILDTDPCDWYRALNRLSRRRLKVGLKGFSHWEIVDMRCKGWGLFGVVSGGDIK